MQTFLLHTEKSLSLNICLKYPLHLIKQHEVKEALPFLLTGDRLAHNESFASWFERVGGPQYASVADEESGLVILPYLFLLSHTIWS